MSANFPPPTGAPMQAASDDVSKVGGRFALSTPGLLRSSRFVLALICLVAGAVGAWVMTMTSASMDDINRGTQQTLRLQQIKGDILRADGLATAGLAQGTAASSLTQYTDALKEAAKLTVEASLAQSSDRADLAAVNADLLTYVLGMERARTAYPKDNASGLSYVTDAGSTLANETVSALDKLISANQKRVADARAQDRLWAAGLALVPVLLIIGVSLWLARRTRRFVNLGLVIALAASAVLWRVVDTSLVASANVVDSARAGSLQTATAASTAYSKLAEAKSIEGRQLLQPSSVGSLEPTWTAALTEAKAAVGKLGAASAAVTSAVEGYQTAHTSLSALLKANKLSDAKASAANTSTGVGPTYAAASEALTKVFNEAKSATIIDLANQQNSLRNYSILAVLLGALAAVASWAGIGLRLREYR